MTEDEMVGWHHQLNGHEQTPGDNKGQGSMVCCSPWDHKESDTTEQFKTDFFFHLLPCQDLNLLLYQKKLSIFLRSKT